MCIFCKIVDGEIPSVKIREDENYLAILDIFPNRKGMTLVIPKKHYDSDIFEMEDSLLQEYIIAAKKVVKILKKGLKVPRVGMVVEGLEVNHAHIKLYPFRDNKGFAELGTTSGQKVEIEELEKVKEEILRNVENND